ncbi:hypothetical protein SMD44_08631 [Streptomyces alboflavus]|uniref:Uncharacterized protein n=1 Tax=Streptomyces alboflavus TaxID=67267 RepID=A0A1Z1WRX5_9ACTN|nr:hypothetical protein SMD44_08631 [Streptomyces alboflavus]
MRGQREHRQRTDAEQREDHFEELGDVGQLHHHAVARRDAAGEQSGGEPVGAGVELAVGPAAVGGGIDDGDPVGVRGGPCPQHAPKVSPRHQPAAR